ncbi:hypothetical protein GGI04_005416 [Coemansia thaxteri]|nr:hypothetical protein GGI04_005416 [Coemansia thaxteri]
MLNDMCEFLFYDREEYIASYLATDPKARHGILERLKDSFIDRSARDLVSDAVLLRPMYDIMQAPSSSTTRLPRNDSLTVSMGDAHIGEGSKDLAYPSNALEMQAGLDKLGEDAKAQNGGSCKKPKIDE